MSRKIIDLTSPACRSHLHPVVHASSVFARRKVESTSTSITSFSAFHSYYVGSTYTIQRPYCKGRLLTILVHLQPYFLSAMQTNRSSLFCLYGYCYVSQWVLYLLEYEIQSENFTGRSDLYYSVDFEIEILFIRCFYSTSLYTWNLTGHKRRECRKFFWKINLI